MERRTIEDWELRIGDFKFWGGKARTGSRCGVGGARKLGTLWKASLPVLLAAGVASAIWVWGGPSEPRYEGKKLSEWLLQVGSPGVAFQGPPDLQGPPYLKIYVERPCAGWEAVRQIGTNALPCLLKWMRYESPLRDRVIGYYSKLPRKLQNSWVEARLIPYRPDRPDQLAMTGFEILGAQAKPAVPELSRLFNDLAERKSLRFRAARCLGYIEGTNSAALFKAQNDPDWEVREWAIMELNSKRGHIE